MHIKGREKNAHQRKEWKKIKIKRDGVRRSFKVGRNLIPGLEGNSSDNYLVVHSSKSSTNEGSNPEDPLF